MKNNKIALVLILMLLNVFLINPSLVKADDFDLKNEREVLFASKRSSENAEPKKTKFLMLKELNKKHNLIGVNLFVYDQLQGKYLPMHNNMELKAEEGFAISLEKYTKKNIYAYIYHVDSTGKVTILSPMASGEGKNPLMENVQYDLPKNAFFNLSKKAGKEHIYILMTTNASSDKMLKNISEVAKLESYAKNFSTAKSTTELIKDQLNIDLNGKKGSIYIHTAAFEKNYSEKITIINKG